MNLLKSLQIQALANAFAEANDDGTVEHEYQLRGIFRWYSKEFHTPLHQVSDLPLIDVLQAYVEETFAAMDIETMEQKRLSLLETEEDRKKRIAAEQQEADEDQAYLEEVRKQEEERLAKAALDPKKGQELISVVGEKAGPIIQTIGGAQMRVLSEQELEQMETKRTIVETQQEPFSMSFDGLSDMGGFDELDGFGSMPHPSRR